MAKFISLLSSTIVYTYSAFSDSVSFYYMFALDPCGPGIFANLFLSR